MFFKVPFPLDEYPELLVVRDSDGLTTREKDSKIWLNEPKIFMGQELILRLSILGIRAKLKTRFDTSGKIVSGKIGKNENTNDAKKSLEKYAIKLAGPYIISLKEK